MMIASVTVECDAESWTRSYDQRGRPQFRCPLHTGEAGDAR